MGKKGSKRSATANTKKAPNVHATSGRPTFSDVETLYKVLPKLKTYC
jgi:hypothetical protein